MKRNALVYVLFSLFFLFVSTTIVYALDAEILPGKWHSEKEKGVFRELNLKADGTGHFVNYAGKASEGKWTLDGNYLKFEAGGEKSGGIAAIEGETLKIQWVADYVRVK
ncbi:hypothetical protein [Desulfopila sp. IMCC35008]|uniref:hypothetical protein n=1 Tax=Desulfopila sp. IMCC35008 TaxID=2653858 RepID=UPI0013D865B8|nr:hypothetical protein [Desulfopila sp. IMCC35008]